MTDDERIALREILALTGADTTDVSPTDPHLIDRLHRAVKQLRADYDEALDELEESRNEAGNLEAQLNDLTDA